MDKYKLAQIIAKDLEEIKMLTEEVSDNQDCSPLIIDLALNKAQVLCKEIELMREITKRTTSLAQEDEIDDDDLEDSNNEFADPELEIVNFDVPEFSDEEETDEEDDEIDFDSTDEDELDEEQEDEDFEIPESEPEEDELTEEPAFDDPISEETIEIKEEETPVIPEIQATELKSELKPGMREISIDDDDDDDFIEPIHLSPLPGSSIKPPMREIPKPEDIAPEKSSVGENFQKEKSLNDSIGENKSVESKISNGPITSLRAAIGLNDRFIFIREIFNNKADKYDEVITQLDKMDSIQNAVSYLKANLTMQKNDASMRFVELLKRRFTK